MRRFQGCRDTVVGRCWLDFSRAGYLVLKQISMPVKWIFAFTSRGEKWDVGRLACFPDVHWEGYNVGKLVVMYKDSMELVRLQGFLLGYGCNAVENAEEDVAPVVWHLALCKSLRTHGPRVVVVGYRRTKSNAAPSVRTSPGCRVESNMKNEKGDGLK